MPVEIAPGINATLVIGYHAAVRILGDPDRFSADPRPWQQTVPNDLPIMPMIEWRPNALRNNGPEHARYRTATNDSLNKVDLIQLRKTIERIAIQIINGFIEDGEADLLNQYAMPLAFTVLNEIIGCPAHIGERVAAASAALFEGVGTAKVNQMFDEAFLELTKLKRAEPGDDVATRLVQHPAKLSDWEMGHQLVTCYSAGSEIPQNLIANTLLLMMSDQRYMSNENGRHLPTTAALDEVLATDPPLANYCITYPRQPVVVDNVWLPADQPVITSMAACTNSPEISTGEYSGGGWNLAWGTGPHTCPEGAQRAAYLIAQDAIDQLFDALPEVKLAIPADQLKWRPGPFHRALAALPVVFPAGPPLPVIE
ncbi:cytochrome P450 [Nocardia paucivorans]|uniref:cytochrome P450 n=1 Tax=Nocardia paucivorans TaxID=114259 RepID=UPI00278BD316|nr:cytochrome P450 [Nocardia paucivorans]